ncbi:MAG: 3'-5' exonuclease, partial [Rhabdochlamydiaceae bacterium]
SEDGLSERALGGIRQFLEIIRQGKEKFAQPPFKEGLRWLVETINYRKAIDEEVKSEKGREFKWGNVEALINSAESYTDLQEFLSTLALEDHTFARTDQADPKNHANITTFHGAKGLEFTLCFLVGLEDQIMPHEKSIAQQGLEEERRLMYVAMTRAKKYLVISMARQRLRHGKHLSMIPSRFLFEIPQHLVQIRSFQDIPSR